MTSSIPFVCCVMIVMHVMLCNGLSPRNSELLEDVDRSSPFRVGVESEQGRKSNEWLTFGHLANAIGVNTFDTVYLPINVNIFVIGMGGNGNLGVEIPHEMLREWLEHMEHVFEHTVVPTQGVPSSPDLYAQDATMADAPTAAAYGHNISMAARVRYKYAFQLIETHPKVLDVIHYHLHSTYRRTGGGDNQGEFAYHADPDTLMELLDDLQTHLSLGASQYNMFVLNPKSSWLFDPSAKPREHHYKQEVYGYRVGLSNAEIDSILHKLGQKDEKTKVKEDEQKKKNDEESGTHEESTQSNDDGHDLAMSKELIEELKREAEWDQPHEESAQDKKLQLLHLKFVEESLLWAEQKLEHGFEAGPRSLDEYMTYLEKQPGGKSYLMWLRNNQFAQENCLVDTWIGQERSVFVDLTAGPFTWGPVVGGEGVRTQSSLPHVDLFASVHDSNEYRKQHKLDDPAKRESMDPQSWSLESLRAEEIVYRDYLKKHCPKKRKKYTKGCKEVYNRLQGLVQMIEQKESNPNKPFVGKNAFSFFNNGEEKGHHFHMEVDQFMSHLTAMMSQSFQHVVTPSSGDHFGLYADRVTFHIYVLSHHHGYEPLDNHFLRLLKDSLNQLKVKRQKFVYATHVLSLADDPVLSMAYATALKTAVVPSLRLDGQFSAIKRLYLDSRVIAGELSHINVHAKAKAQALARHKYAREHASRVKRHRYIHDERHSTADSKRHDNKGKKMKHHAGHQHRSHGPRKRHRHIPIFLFSQDHPLPLFVDKYYQSKAVDGVVVAVQSSQHLWESHLTCNQRSIYWNLRDPVRSIVSSAAMILGGLLPPHLSYSVAHNRTTQNWLWSTGSSPLSGTSTGYTFSQIQADTVHRNYVVNGIRLATSTVNEAVEKLKKQPTTIGNEVLKLLQARSSAQRQNLRKQMHDEEQKFVYPYFLIIRLTHERVRTILSELWTDVDSLDFAEAVTRLPLLQRVASRFAHLIDLLIAESSRHECVTRVEPTQIETSYYLYAGIVCIAVTLLRLLRGRKLKPKVN